MASKRQIARDVADYLRENPGVTGRGSTRRYHWLRFADGEWRLAKYGGQHQLSEYVDGATVSEDRALAWIESNPATPIPSDEAGTGLTDSNPSVWEEADEQDVFTDADRCFWCGASERTVDLDRYETTEQGECLFCPDCHESWEKAGEIVGRAEVTA